MNKTNTASNCLNITALTQNQQILTPRLDLSRALLRHSPYAEPRYFVETLTQATITVAIRDADPPAKSAHGSRAKPILKTDDEAYINFNLAKNDIF